MQHPALRTRLGWLWYLLWFAASWSLPAMANVPDIFGAAPARLVLTVLAGHSAQPVLTTAVAAPADSQSAGAAIATTIAVTNSQSPGESTMGRNGAVVHAIPALDGFGLFVLAASLGLAALWLWRRRQ